jgi:hypothetical protein
VLTTPLTSAVKSAKPAGFGLASAGISEVAVLAATAGLVFVGVPSTGMAWIAGRKPMAVASKAVERGVSLTMLASGILGVIWSRV